MNIIKKKMIGLRTILKLLALICLVNLTYIRAEEAAAAAAVENKVDAPVEANTATTEQASEGNLRFMSACVDRACASNAQCCKGYFCNLNACIPK